MSPPATTTTPETFDAAADKKAVLAVCQTMLNSLSLSGAEGRAAFLAQLAPKGSATHGRRLMSSSHGFEHESFPDGFADRIPWSLPRGTMEERIDGAPTVLLDHDLAMVWTPYWFRNGERLTHVGTNCFTLLKARWPAGTTGEEGEMVWRVGGLTDTARPPTEEDKRRLGFS